jgi:acylphosphatase
VKEMTLLASGKVQGVFFRLETKKKADKLVLKGCAKNLADGRVEVVVQGKVSKLEKLRDWLMEKGPKMAEIEDLSWEIKDLENRFSSFEIK